MTTAARKHLRTITPATGAAVTAFWVCFAGSLQPMEPPGSAMKTLDQEQLESAPIHVDIENMTRSLSVMVIEVRSETASDKPITHIKLAVRNDCLAGVVAFELGLPSGGQGQLSSLVDYFLSVDHPGGLQPEETIYRIIVIPASPSPVIRVSGLLLADGGSDGEAGAISEMRSLREGQVFQTGKAIALLSRWLMRSDLNVQVTDDLLMIKNEIGQLEEEGPSDRGVMYGSGLQYVKTYLRIWIESILESAGEGHSPPDLEAIIRTRLAALQRAVSAD
jgi:hypothetical protein